jgi:hypothetical protein
MNARDWLVMSIPFIEGSGISIDDILFSEPDAERWHKVDKRQLAKWKARLAKATTDEEKALCEENVTAYQAFVDAYLEGRKDNETVEQEADKSE